MVTYSIKDDIDTTEWYFTSDRERPISGVNLGSDHTFVITDKSDTSDYVKIWCKKLTISLFIKEKYLNEYFNKIIPNYNKYWAQLNE